MPNVGTGGSVGSVLDGGGGGGGQAVPDANSTEVPAGVETAPMPDAPLPVCDYPAWELMKPYKAGDIVMFMGRAYVALHDHVQKDPVQSTYYWAPYAGCMPPPPAKCEALDKLLPEGEVTYKKMFEPPFERPVIADVYSYGDLCKAMMTPALRGFAASGNILQDKRELAAFFANVAIETAYLSAVDQMGHSPSARTYHGRGSLQITGEANYTEAGAGLGLSLSAMPQLASQKIVVWQTGLWYWMRHANPSVTAPNVCHQAIVASDFGRTVRIIHPTCSRAAERAAQYRKNCAMLGVPDPGKTTCP